MVRLADWEKKLLPLSLVTTKAEAKQIVKRNRSLLWRFRLRIRRGSRYGCPHCLCPVIGPPQCYNCRWMLTSGIGRSCIGFEFDGVALNKQHCVKYGPTAEKVVQSKVTPRKDVTKFLKAHILWGKRMIDGTYKRYAERHGVKIPRRIGGIWKADDAIL